jgi:PKD domain-containing protein
MRVNTTATRVLMAIVLCVCVHGARVARSEESATPAAPQYTPGQLTEEQEALLKTLVLLSSADPDEGPAPLTVQFSTESLDETVNPKYVWNFGDGSKEMRGQNVTHTYKKPGEYKAIVRVTDDDGNAGKDDVPITVQRPEKKQ